VGGQRKFRNWDKLGMADNDHGRQPKSGDKVQRSRKVSCGLPCLREGSHDVRHVIPSRALSPPHDEDEIYSEYVYYVMT
jgi:hypothetical protein